jgi:hypothetical protein
MSSENEKEVETRKLNLLTGSLLALTIIFVASVVAILLMNTAAEPTSTKPQ